MDQKLISIWMRITNKLTELEKIPQEYQTGHPLFPSEIHTIQAIGDEGTTRVGDLAGRMGVTSGAVSQMVRKLANKGLVQKRRGEMNEKEVFISLTNLGNVAYAAHDKIHHDISALIEKKTGPLSENENALIMRVFSVIEETIDEIRAGKAHRVRPVQEER